jgi:hypothetical protein
VLSMSDIMRAHAAAQREAEDQASGQTGGHAPLAG